MKLMLGFAEIQQQEVTVVNGDGDRHEYSSTLSRFIGACRDTVALSDLPTGAGHAAGVAASDGRLRCLVCHSSPSSLKGVR
jgi:hypothetical protein